MTDLINPEEVHELFLRCLFIPGEPIVGAVKAEGLLCTVGFHPQRLQESAGQVRHWLSLLPVAYRKQQGGGWSFLNACTQQDGRQWTGLHQRMDQLFTLGIALGMAYWCTHPRELWDLLPGGMPYVAIDLQTKSKAAQLFTAKDRA